MPVPEKGILHEHVARVHGHVVVPRVKVAVVDVERRAVDVHGVVLCEGVRSLPKSMTLTGERA